MESTADEGLLLSTECDEDYEINMTNIRHMQYTSGTTILITVVLPCILAVGVLSNGAFLFVLFRVRWMRTITNFYLANLSIADISFLIVAGAEHFWGYANSPIPGDDMHLGMAGCILVTLIIYISYFGSLLLVTLVSLHRFFAICCPNKQELIGSRSRTTKLVTGTWAISIIIAVLLIPSVSNFITVCLTWPDDIDSSSLPAIMGSCNPVTAWVAGVSTLAQTIPFFVAILGNSIMYTKIIRSLTTRVEMRKQRKSTASPTTVERARDRVARMLIANGVIFFICLAPFQAMGFAEVITSQLNTPVLLNPAQYDTFLWFARMLGYSNSAINPIIYNATNPRYRQAFREAFPCLPAHKDSDSPPQSQMTRNFRSTNNTQHYTTCVSKL